MTEKNTGIAHELLYGVLPMQQLPPPAMVDAKVLELIKIIKEAGLYTYHSTFKMFLWTCLIASSGLVIFTAGILLPSTLYTVLTLSFLFGVHTVHVGFIGHDFAHNTGFKSAF